MSKFLVELTKACKLIGRNELKRHSNKNYNKNRTFGFLPVSSTNLAFQSKLFNTVKWKVDHDLSKVRSLSIRGIQVFLRIRRIYEHCLAIQGREHVCSMSGQIKTSLPKRQHPRVLSYDACAL